MPGQQLTKTYDDTPQSWITLIAPKTQDYFAKVLPSRTARPEGFIAVNKDGDRLDAYFPAPSKHAMDNYARRTRVHKVCNKYHLGGECGDLSCEFDHSEVEPEIIEVLSWILRQTSCRYTGRCRSIKCYQGHHCQKEGCRGGKGCKFGRRGHIIDLHLAKWDVPIDQPEVDGRLSPASEMSADTDSMAEELSVLDMTKGSHLSTRLLY